MSRKYVAVALLVFLGLTVPARAGQRHVQGPVPHQQSTEAIEAVQDFLGLSEEQVARWQDLQAARASVKHEQFNQVRELELQLREELESNSPSADRVGELVIRLNESRREQAKAIKAFTDQVRAILTAEQLAELEQVEESLSVRKLSDALFRTGFLAPPPPPPPPPHAPAAPHAPLAPPPPPPPPPLHYQ